MEPRIIRADVYEFGDAWAFCAGGFKDEGDAKDAARVALNVVDGISVSFSSSNSNFYGWALDAVGRRKVNSDGREAPPKYEAHFYAPRPDFWCVWAYGFDRQGLTDLAVDKAIAKVRGDGSAPAYARGGANAEAALA